MRKPIKVSQITLVIETDEHRYEYRDNGNCMIWKKEFPGLLVRLVRFAINHLNLAELINAHVWRLRIGDSVGDAVGSLSARPPHD